MTDPAKKDDCSSLLSTGDMARLTKSTHRTVRFYEEVGLIAPVAHSCGGHRMFDDCALKKLQFALDLRKAGMSVQDIKSLFALKLGADCPQTASTTIGVVLGDQLTALDEQISTLERLKAELSRMQAQMATCGDCTDPGYPEGCHDCERVDRQDSGRAWSVLWPGPKSEAV
ncbi:MAG: MerR family transcriptional regulator [Polyangiales bacterium]